MGLDSLKVRFKKLTVCLELVLAGFIAVAVVVGMVDLFRYIILIYTTNPLDTYEIFQKFLGHALLLVVGVELVAMLILHTPGSVIEVLLYAVARNMLIGSHSTVDFIYGIVAIAAIFATRKFLFIETISNGSDCFCFSAATPVDEVNRLMGVNIPRDMGNTLGGIAGHLSRQTCRPLHEGAFYSISDARIKIIRIKDHFVEAVSVMKVKITE